MKRIIFLTITLLSFGLGFGQVTVTYDFSDGGAVTGLNEADPGIALDANIGFGSFKNSGTSNPALNSGQLRLYQNATKGGSIKIYASNGVTITSVVVNASGTTGPAEYTVDGGAATSLTASTTYTMTGLSATDNVEFYQKDGSSSNRIYVNSFTVIYTMPGSTVTFDANGGTGTMLDQTESSSTALNPNTFIRSGYTFTGWNTASDGSGTAYADGATYDFTADATMYAQWTVISTPTITVTPSSLTGLDYIVGSGPSAEQSFDVEGTLLVAGIDITSPTNFLISLTSGGPYTSTVNIPLADANDVNTVYVILESGLAINTYSGNITMTNATSGLATPPSVAVSGEVSTSLSVCLTDDFNSGYGNWTNGSGTYNNTTAGTTGNGVGFNDNNDDIITSSSLTNPASISFNARASGTTSNYTINIQYSTSASGPWTTAQTLAANGSNSGDITTSTQAFNYTLGLTGTYFLRILQSPRSGGSFYLDDVEVTCGALVPTPEINIQGNATDIADGNTTISTTDDTDFGDVLITGGSQANTFTIQNTGTADLTLTSVVSSNATDFVVSGTTSGVIAAGDSVTFTVTFDPSTTGTKTSTITILSDDADEATYTFDVEGNGTDIPSIVLHSSNPAVAAGNILADSDVDNTVIYAFDLTVTNFDADLTAFDFTTQAGYAAGNVTNFKAWYSSDATFDSGTDVFLDNVTTSLGAGSHSFTGFNQTIASGSTGYIFITADLPCGATANNTITVSAITTSDLTFAVGTATGTAYDGGTQTITEAVPNNVTSLATANCENGGVDVSWTAATGCEDNYIVVASPTALTTSPSGNGGSYTANAVYGSGSAYDGGYVVYKGTGTSVSISGLTNGTNYTYTVFTRNGTSWSSGVNIDCTPTLDYCTSSGASNNSGILNVSFNTINNATSSANGYGDYTSLSTDLNIGDSYNLDVNVNTNGSYTSYVIVWIDWNQDGDFTDSGEEYELGSITNSSNGSPSLAPLSITVPSGALVGATTMRVSANSDNSVSGYATSCESFTYGEVEDYSVEILPLCTPTHSFTSMAPTSGPAETEITVTGTGFTASTTASFGGVAATVDFVDTTTLIVHVPASATTSTITLTEAACDIETGTFTIIEESGACASGSGFTNLFISEVYDSDGGNAWYMELYNPTSSAIDLGALGYEIDRYSEQTSSVSRTVDLVGIVPANSVFTLNLGDDDDCSVTTDFVESGAGINEDDEIRLTLGGVIVDNVEAPGNIGYTILRDPAATGPTATYNAADWTTNSTESCDSLGSFSSIATFSSPTISAITDASDCALLDFSVTATAGNSGALTYVWYFNDGTASGWTTLNATNLSGYTLNGVTTNNLTIASDTNPLSDLDTYQFYCEVTEDASCSVVSNAEKFVFSSDRYYKSVVAGNWNVISNWEVAPTASGPWSAACTYPTETNSDSISIENGANITLNIDLAADQIVIQSGATLFLDEKLTVANGNAVGEDLEVIGTLEDHGNTTNGLVFINGGTWKLDAAGTIIKTNNSSVNNYRDAYETGIANIPATADWAFVYDGSGNVSVASLGMYYPNLYFESTSGARDASSFAEFFQGSSGFTTVKGDLEIGVGTISGGTDTYKVYNNNTNTQPMLILGDVYIGAGSEFTNLDVSAGTDNGTGIEVKGSFLVNGTIDMTGGTGITLLSGTATQDIVSLGTGVFETYEFELANTTNAELDGIDVGIDSTLTFTDGKIITDVTTADMVWVKNKLTTAIVGGVAQNSTSKYVEGKLKWTTDGVSTYTFPIGDATHQAQGFTTDLVSGTTGAEILAFLETNNSSPIYAYAYCDLETHPGPAGATINAGNGSAGYDGVDDQIEFNIASPLQWNITNPSTEQITEYDLVVLAAGTQDISPVTTANSVEIRYLMKNGEPGNPGYVTTSGAPSFSATGFDACPNQYTLTGLTSFSKFTLDGATQSATTLPVDLLFFDAVEVDNISVQTSWATVTEINNDYFTVERSQDGVIFEFVGNVQGAGNYNGQLNYDLLDENPYRGVSYYRLKQTDFDGQYEYSNIVAVNLKDVEHTVFSVYPIPVNSAVTVNVNSDEEVFLVIYDMSGKKIVSDVFVSTKEFDLSNISAGTYFMSLQTATEKEVIKLIKE